MAVWRVQEAAAERHYLQAVQEELHAIEVEEHLTVVRRLVCDVPQRAPGELHDLVTLRAGEGSAQACLDRPRGLLAPSEGSLTKHGHPRGKPVPCWDAGGQSGSMKTRLTILSSSFF